MSSWVEEELEGADFGDKRLVDRYSTVLKALSDKPQLSIPAASGGWAETIAAYRFFDNDSVTVDAILAPHREASIKRIAQQDVVVIAQDTTVLNLTRPKQQIKGTGPLSDEHNCGMFDHVGLAIATNGIPLGTVFAEYWSRDWDTFYANKQLTKSQKVKIHKETRFEDKESSRWLRGYEQGCDVARQCPSTQIVVVSDSEADILDCFNYAKDQQAKEEPSAHWITRAAHDRNLEKSHEYTKLWDAVGATPVRSVMEINVSENEPQSGDKTKRNQARKARQTRVEIRTAVIEVKGQPRIEGNLESQKINVVYVREINPPEGEKPIEWLLLTSLSVESLEDAMFVINCYVLRWKIELYFRILKVGCGIEKLQFETVARFERCLAMYMIVAWRVFYAMMLGRECPDISCEAIFAEEEWQSLYVIVKKQPPPKSPPPLGEAMKIVASLGGYLGRKGDGPPGPQTTWIGMQRVKDFAIAWQAFGPAAPPIRSTCV
jgi:hypothetical protein